MKFHGRILFLVLSVAWAAPAQTDGPQVHRGLVYTKPGGNELKLDLYLPRKARPPTPLVVWIHGGGWSKGSRTRCPAVSLTKARFAVASIDYRLAPAARFPAQIHDCKAAVRWLRANAERYGIDPKRIGAWGSSAGGHLAALLGTSGDVQDLEGEGGHPKQSSRVQAVVDFCGPTDLRLLLKGPAVSALLGDATNAVAASPVVHASRDDPPFFIVHGAKDRLVPVQQAELLHAALRKRGVNAYLHVIEEAGHSLHDPSTHALAQLFFERNLR
ncbi:MAG: alpha/beta hydrolase fold domain-containing protein [Planctomycetota bacterium]|jgi:acetyl esterase/lipase